jgi:hypothetical protein
MIRKMLVIAAAVAMPAVAVAGATAISGAGIASAKASPPVAVTCSISGSLTFAKPGLTPNGTLTNKTVEDTKTAITPGGAAACGTKAIKNKIATATTPCTDPSPAPICTTAPAKTLAKDPNYFGSLGSLLSAPSSILTSLAAGVKTTDNGTKITLVPTAVGTILPGAACGATEVGFNLSGTVSGGAPAVSSFNMNVCLGGDTGTATTNHFFADYTGGNPALVLATATLDPATSSVALS